MVRLAGARLWKRAMKYIERSKTAQGFPHRGNGRRDRNGRCARNRRHLEGVDRDDIKKESQEERVPLIVAVVTKPFANEAKERMRNADVGVEELKKYVDALIVIPNEKLPDDF